MAVAVKCVMLYDRLAPATEADARDLEALTRGQVYKLVITQPRGVNSDNPSDEERSDAQNRLYWAWLHDMEKTKVNEYAGNDDEWWHTHFKERFLVRIYERDNQGFAELMGAIRRLKELGEEARARLMFDFVVAETSTTKASVHQFSEYLGRIERYCQQRGIWLRTDAKLLELARLEGYW